MPRYEMVIDDADRDYDPVKPWTAGLWQMDEVLKTSGDLLVAGVGATPMSAVQDLLDTAMTEQGDALEILLGSGPV